MKAKKGPSFFTHEDIEMSNFQSPQDSNVRLEKWYGLILLKAWSREDSPRLEFALWSGIIES